MRHSQWVFFIGCSEFVVCSSAPLVLWDLAVSNLHVLTTMVSFIVMWKIPDLPCWYLLHPLGGLADTLGRIPPIPAHPAPIPSRFPGRQVTSLTTQVSNSPFPVNPPITDLHTGSGRDSPPFLNSQHTPVQLFPYSQHSLYCKTQLTSPSYNLVIPLPTVSTRQFRCNKTEEIWLL